MVKRVNIMDKALFLLAILLTILIKLSYSNADNSDMEWVLLPVVKVVSVFTGAGFSFLPQSGYVSIGGDIVIGKSCAGINYFVIVLLMTVFSFLPFFERRKTLVFTIFLALSFLIAFMVNAFRILGAIFLTTMDDHSDFVLKGITHEAQGILFYFFFLLIYYLSLHHFMLKRSSSIEGIS